MVERHIQATGHSQSTVVRMALRAYLEAESLEERVVRLETQVGRLVEMTDPFTQR